MAQEIKKTTPSPTPIPRYMDPFSAMRAEMDRVFDAFLGPSFGRLPLLSRREPEVVVVPSIDVRETESELVVEAELPGLDEKDVSVKLQEGVLTLQGEKKSEREEKKDDYHLMERGYGSFQRSFRVPETIDADKAKATFEKGVLKVTHTEAR